MSGRRTISRPSPSARSIRVVATVQVAYFFEDDVDFETEFEQDLPLAAVALAVGVNPLALQAAGAVL